MDDNTKQDTDAPQFLIRLVTKQTQYAVPDSPLSIHAACNPSELNDLVNGLLRESNGLTQNVEFDFLICSEILRTSISELIDEKNISKENIVEIEYVQKLPPPEPQDCLIHDDWVSAVAVRKKWILTGCYDNTIHLWTSKGKHHLTIPGHTRPVKAVAWISFDGKNGRFVSASEDQTVRIWEWNVLSNTVECTNVCKGHARELEAVGINDSCTLMATGAWDQMLKIWSTSLNDDDENDESTSKKTKTESSKTRLPQRTMKGHKDAISGVVWSDKMEIITSSWDHTLKIWDSELGGMKHEIAGNKVFFDIDYSPLSRTVIASSADWHVRLYDPRSTEGTVVKSKFTSHTQWVKSVRWSKTNEHLFVSGAYDNYVKLWDSRSPKAPLYDLMGHEDIVLSCNWSNPELIVSGSADKTLRIFKSRSTTM